MDRAIVLWCDWNVCVYTDGAVYVYRGDMYWQ